MGLVPFLEDHLLSCPWKQVGLECTGCGLQRSIILILKGEFVAAFAMYPSKKATCAIPGFFSSLEKFLMFVFMGFHLKFNFEKGAQILKWLFVLNIGIIVTQYILKLI